MKLISKGDVIKALQKWNCRDYDSLTINPYEVLRDIPTIEERKEGRWIDHSNEGYVECPFCGSCNTCEDNIDELHFCFNCGNKLKGEE